MGLDHRLVHTASHVFTALTDSSYKSTTVPLHSHPRRARAIRGSKEGAQKSVRANHPSIQDRNSVPARFDRQGLASFAVRVQNGMAPSNAWAPADSLSGATEGHHYASSWRPQLALPRALVWPQASPREVRETCQRNRGSLGFMVFDLRTPIRSAVGHLPGAVSVDFRAPAQRPQLAPTRSLIS